MARRNDSTLARNKPEDLLGRITRHMPYRHQFLDEWPYMAGSACLVALLIWQPFEPSALAVMLSQPQPRAQSMQRSLQEIDSNCYQVHSEALNHPHCEECSNDTAAAARPDAEFELSRSILTCSDTDRPDNMMIEVIKSNHSF
ncbi:hypothetical protein [Pseudomonas sp.]|uniref:hypothetical protein n=1 Tax=Pseudomonas sp. TaxID=306 RepID=UPI003A9757A6